MKIQLVIVTDSREGTHDNHRQLRTGQRERPQEVLQGRVEELTAEGRKEATPGENLFVVSVGRNRRGGVSRLGLAGVKPVSGWMWTPVCRDLTV